MTIRSLRTLFAASVLAVVGMSGIAHADMPACRSSYTISGSMFTGRIAKLYDSFPGVSPEVVYKRMYVSLMSYGWRIGQSNKDMGVISAVDGAGKVSYNVLIEPDGSGSKVSVTVNLGTLAGLSDIKTELCSPMVAADNAPSQ